MSFENVIYEDKCNNRSLHERFAELEAAGWNVDDLEREIKSGRITTANIDDITTPDEYYLNNILYDPDKPPIIPLCAVNIETRPVNWLWHDVLVQGGLNSIQGIAGVGKTFMLCAVVAAVSNGGSVQSTGGRYGEA